MQAGTPYKSCLNPYINEIIELRKQGTSYADIVEYLRDKYQISISRQSIFNFVKVRSSKYKPQNNQIKISKHPISFEKLFALRPALEDEEIVAGINRIVRQELETWSNYQKRIFKEQNESMARKESIVYIAALMSVLVYSCSGA